METPKEEQLKRLLKRDEAIVGIVIAERDSGIPVLSVYNQTSSESGDRSRHYISSMLTFIRNSNKLGKPKTCL